MTAPTAGALDSAQCYVCDEPMRPRRLGTNDVLVCGGCGFGRLLAKPVADDYWTRTNDDENELGERYWTTSRTAVFTAALDYLAGGTTGRRLLDLGGGVGHFAACALDRGWDAYSFDISPAAHRAAGERLGAERALSSLPDSLLGTFDVVTLWCVAAHVVDPRSVVAEAGRALRPGGRLFLTTPNFRFQAGYARVLAAGRRPFDFAAHDHVVHFTADALRLVLQQAGLEGGTFTYVGVTEDCLLNRRLSPVLVPAKRMWNRSAVWLSRRRVPLLSSELQVVASKP